MDEWHIPSLTFPVFEHVFRLTEILRIIRTRVSDRTHSVIAALGMY